MFGVRTGVNDSIHVNVEIVHLESGWIWTSGIEGHADGALAVDELDALFEDILNDFWILFREESKEGGNSHGTKEGVEYKLDADAEYLVSI